MVNISEQGNDVVYSFSGSLDLTGQPRTDFNHGSVYALAFGGTDHSYVASLAGWDFSRIFTASSTGQLYSAQSVVNGGIRQGDDFGYFFDGTRLELYYDQNYVSGDAISGSLTYQNQTYASLNLIEGAEKLIDFGSDTISITVGTNAADISAVPLPASLPLVLAGMGVFGFLRRKQA